MNKETVDVLVREAVPEDAAGILRVSKKIGSETPYLVMDEAGMNMDEESMAFNLENLYESSNNVLLLAIIEDKIVGTASIKASFKKRIEHIGEIGISVLQEYWGFGIGSLLMEELIQWAKDSEVIRRLELTVQDRNKRAIYLYKKMGFKDEVIMPRGAKTDTGDFLDVHLMSMMIDKIG